MLICAAVLFCDSNISNPYQTLPTDQTLAVMGAKACTVSEGCHGMRQAAEGQRP